MIIWSNALKLTDIFLNNPWVKEVSREVKKYIELNENETTTYQNLWAEARAVVRGKCIEVNSYIKNEEMS